VLGRLCRTSTYTSCPGALCSDTFTALLPDDLLPLLLLHSMAAWLMRCAMVRC
jgi:hypothetical protein